MAKNLKKLKIFLIYWISRKYVSVTVSATFMEGQIGHLHRAHSKEGPIF